MRASQNKAILSSWGDPTACRLHLESHRRRLMDVRPVVDVSPPSSIEAYHHGDYPKKTMQSQAEVEKVTKDNLLLAKRIFAIMEGPGMISELIRNTAHIERHPGTLNFNQRLFEARRIHNENIALASRLDSMKPFYAKEDTAVLMKMRKAYIRNKRARNTPFIKGIHAAMRSKRAPKNSMKEGVDASAMPAAVDQNQNPQHVLLEYTMIQDDRILEVAVIKEPFRDRYVIFGIDVESGQRFELWLTSDEVSSILDGDILVTSVDHVEVWMALLQKIRLQPVQEFSKLTGPNDCYDQESEQVMSSPDELPHNSPAQEDITPEYQSPEPPSNSPQRSSTSSHRTQKLQSESKNHTAGIAVAPARQTPKVPTDPKRSAARPSPRFAGGQSHAMNPKPPVGGPMKKGSPSKQVRSPRVPSTVPNVEDCKVAALVVGSAMDAALENILSARY